MVEQRARAQPPAADRRSRLAALPAARPVAADRRLDILAKRRRQRALIARRGLAIRPAPRPRRDRAPAPAHRARPCAALSAARAAASSLSASSRASAAAARPASAAASAASAAAKCLEPPSPLAAAALDRRALGIAVAERRKLLAKPLLLRRDPRRLAPRRRRSRPRRPAARRASPPRARATPASAASASRDLRLGLGQFGGNPRRDRLGVGQAAPRSHAAPLQRSHRARGIGLQRLLARSVGRERLAISRSSSASRRTTVSRRARAVASWCARVAPRVARGDRRIAPRGERRAACSCSACARLHCRLQPRHFGLGRLRLLRSRRSRRGRPRPSAR